MEEQLLASAQAALEGFVHDQLGRCQLLAYPGRSHGGTRVWCARRGAQPLAFVKRHASRRKFVQEARAYALMAGQSPPLSPVCLASCDELQVLILEVVHGELLARTATTRRNWYAVGDALRRFHELVFEDTDTVPLGIALELRAAAMFSSAAGHVPGSVLQRVRESWLRSGPMQLVRRRYCHRDFDSENCFVRADGSSAVSFIDFEHSGPDAVASDLCRLELDEFFHDEAAREAFSRGYGGEQLHAEAPNVAKLALLHALNTCTWAARHRDADLAATGARRLARALEFSRGI